MELRPDFEARLHSEGTSFSDRDAALLRAVREQGSINGAADALGRSCSRSLRRIVDLEEAFGPLVERQRGGNRGGGSELTANACRLLGRFVRLQTKFTDLVAVDETVVAGTVTDREGRIATVETPAGSIRALASTSATDVRIPIRGDVVALDLSEAPDARDAPHRNCLRGTATAVEVTGSIAQIEVDVGGDVALSVLETRAGADALDSPPEEPAWVTFKPTAVRAVPTDEEIGSRTG